MARLACIVFLQSSPSKSVMRNLSPLSHKGSLSYPVTNALSLSFPTPSPASFTSSHLIHFPAHLIFLLLGPSPPPIFYLCPVELSSLSLSHLLAGFKPTPNFDVIGHNDTSADGSRVKAVPLAGNVRL